MSRHKYGRYRYKPEPSVPTILLAWLAGIAVTVVVGYSVFRLGVMIDAPIYASLANSSPGRLLISPGRVLILIGVLLGLRSGSYVGGIVLSGKSRGTFFSDVLLWLPALLVFFAVFVAVSQHGVNGRLITGEDALWLGLLCLFTGFVVATGIVVVVAAVFEHLSDRKRRRREKEQANPGNHRYIKAAPHPSAAAATKRMEAKRKAREEELKRVARATNEAQAQSAVSHAKATQAAADFEAWVRNAKQAGVRFSMREQARIAAMRASLHEDLRRNYVENQRQNKEQLHRGFRKESE